MENGEEKVLCAHIFFLPRPLIATLSGVLQLVLLLCLFLFYWKCVVCTLILFIGNEKRTILKVSKNKLPCYMSACTSDAFTQLNSACFLSQMLVFVRFRGTHFYSQCIGKCGILYTHSMFPFGYTIPKECFPSSHSPYSRRSSKCEIFFLTPIKHNNRHTSIYCALHKIMK